MPIGVICNALAIVIGGLIGHFVGDRVPGHIKDKLNMVFGVCSMGLGIYSICLMENMPAVVLSLIVGTLIGAILHLGDALSRGGEKLMRRVQRNAGADPEKMALLVTCMVLFCSSGTGIYGSIVSGMSGDHSVLIAKTFLDLPTALIFGCSLGAVVSLIAVPQFIIFMALFLLSKLIFPLTTPAMTADFKACGGLIMLATGFRIAKVKDFPIADMIPAMALVMPVSALWSSYILPLL